MMKKILQVFLLLHTPALPMFCMEKPEHVGLADLPDEIKLSIFSFMAHAASLNAVSKNLVQLSLVSREFSRLVNDDYFQKNTTSTYIKKHADRLWDDLFKAIEHRNRKGLKALIDAGISVNQEDSLGTALDSAIRAKPSNPYTLESMNEAKDFDYIIRLLRQAGALTKQELSFDQNKEDSDIELIETTLAGLMFMVPICFLGVIVGAHCDQ